MKGNQQRGKSR